MTKTNLLDKANEAMIEFDRIVARYRYDTVGLQADATLLEHANSSFLPAKNDSGELDVELYLDHIRSGKARLAAARLCGIEDTRFIKKRLQFDQSFRELVELAEEEAAEKIEEMLWTLANNGERWAMEMWLKKRNKDRWGEDVSVVRHEGTVVQELSAAPLVDQILALQAVLDKRAELTTGNSQSIIDVEVVED